MNLMTKPGALLSGAETACSVRATGIAHDRAGGTKEVNWALPEEIPVAVLINSENYAVMMATPADLRDFAIGLLLAEGIIASIGAIRGVLVMPVESGMAVDVAIEETAIDRARIGTRAIEGRTGCGLCGVEDIAAALKPLPRLSNRFSPSPEAILDAAGLLPSRQPMNLTNHTVHAAAWISGTGGIVTVREDVGRHNALDKLIGALAQAKTETSQGFVLMTSRCSFELVQKCALAGIGALVTVSAPTALALELAKKSGMYLAALGAGGVVIFNA